CGIVAAMKIPLVRSVDPMTWKVLAPCPADDAAVIGESAQIKRVHRALPLKDVEHLLDPLVDEAVRPDLHTAGFFGHRATPPQISVRSKRGERGHPGAVLQKITSRLTHL